MPLFATHTRSDSGVSSVTGRPSVSTSRPCSSRACSARLCSATSSQASLSTGDPDEPGSVSVR